MNSFDFFRLWSSLLQRRWLIITITCVAFFGSMVYAYKKSDYYAAKVKIYVQNVDQSALKKDEILMPLLDRTTYYRTQMELIKSRDILETSAEQLNLPDYYGKKMFETVRALEKKVSTKLIAGTQIIEVTVKDKSPKMASEIANTIVENFVKQSLKDRLFISDQILKWFPDAASTLQKGTLVEQLKRIDKDDISGTLPSVMRDPVIQELKQEKAKVDSELQELSKRYTPEHPRMKELNAKADYLEKEIKSQSDKVISGLKAGLSGAFNVTDIKIVEKAMPAQKPAGPNRLLIIMVVTLAALYGGILLALFLEYVDRKIKTESDLKLIGLPFLGYLPVISGLNRKRGNAKSEPKLVQMMSARQGMPINEIMEIRTAILFSMPKDRQKVIVVTSALPEEGKTTVASLLAASFAEAGERTLLIDADILRPAVHKYFGLENTRGLSYAIVGLKSPDDCIQEIKALPRLSVMTASSPTPNAAMLLNSEAFSNLMDGLKHCYDRIIVDIPPILVVADGLLTTKKADGIVAVFCYDRIHVNAAKKFREKLDSTQCPVIGAVVNQANYKKTSPYDGYRYHYYSKYYYQGHHGKAKKSGAKGAVGK